MSGNCLPLPDQSRAASRARTAGLAKLEELVLEGNPQVNKSVLKSLSGGTRYFAAEMARTARLSTVSLLVLGSFTSSRRRLVPDAQGWSV